MLFKTVMQGAESFPRFPSLTVPFAPAASQPQETPCPQGPLGQGRRRKKSVPSDAEAAHSQPGYRSPPPSAAEVTWWARRALLRCLLESLLPTKARQTCQAAGGAREGRGDRQCCRTSTSKTSPAHQSQLSYVCTG